MFSVPQYANLQSKQEVSYLCNLNYDKDSNIKFLRDKKIIVLRNCDSTGLLIDLKTSCTKLVTKPWVMLKIKSFCVEGNEVDVPVCVHCNDCTDFLTKAQSYETLVSAKCINC